MPLRIFLILIGLYACCLAIVGVAWGTGGELYFWMPPIRQGGFGRPPTPTIVVFGMVVVAAMLTAGLRNYGVFILYIATAGIFFGSVIGYFAYHWTPTWPQHLLTIALVTTTIYASKQTYYLDE